MVLFIGYYLVSIGMSLVIITGDVDLSVGSIRGFLNGIMVGKVKMPAFIATPATDARNAMCDFGNGKILSLTACGVISVIIAIFMIYLTASTKYGKRLFAISNTAKPIGKNRLPRKNFRGSFLALPTVNQAPRSA